MCVKCDSVTKGALRTLFRCIEYSQKNSNGSAGKTKINLRSPTSIFNYNNYR